MAIPEAIRRTKRRHLEGQELAKPYENSVQRQGASLYGCLPDDWCRQFNVAKGDPIKTYPDFSNGVLLTTPEELVDEVNRP